MGLFDSDFSFPGAPYFDGAMTSEGSGARVRLDVKDIPVIGDVNVVNVSVPGFKRGGVIPGRGPSRSEADASRAASSQAKLAALHRSNGAPRGAGPGPRQGGADAPTRRSSSGSSSSSASGHQHAAPAGSAAGGHRFGGIGDGIAPLTPGIGMGGRRGRGATRRKDEIHPGVPCPSCAMGLTTPVR